MVPRKRGFEPRDEATPAYSPPLAHKPVWDVTAQRNENDEGMKDGLQATPVYEVAEELYPLHAGSRMSMPVAVC